MKIRVLVDRLGIMLIAAVFGLCLPPMALAFGFLAVRKLAGNYYGRIIPHYWRVAARPEPDGGRVD